MKRVCKKCGIEKELDELVFNSDCKYERENFCIQCKKIQDKEYYQKNKDKILNYVKNYSIENKDKIKEYKKEYSLKNKDGIIKKYKQDNKEKLKKQAKEWRDNNPDKVLKMYENRKPYQKEYRLNNKDKINQKEKEKLKTDPIFKLKNNIRTLFKSSLKYNSVKKQNRFFYYTGIQYSEYIDYLSKSDLWNDYCDGKNLHIDHIIPVALYDLKDFEEIKKCWHPHNLRIIDAKENLIKNKKLDLELIIKHNIKHLLPKGLKL